MFTKQLSFTTCLVLIGFTLSLSGCGKSEPERDIFEDVGSLESRDAVGDIMSEHGYICSVIQHIPDIPGHPTPVYEDGRLIRLEVTGREEMLYITPDGPRVVNNNLRPPIILATGEILLIKESDTGFIVQGRDGEWGPYDSVESPYGKYAQLFTQVKKKDGDYHIVGDQEYGPFFAIHQRGYHNDSKRFFIYAQKNDQKWYFIDNEGETLVSPNGYFLMANDGADVLQMYYPDPENAGPYMIIAGQRVDNTDRSGEFLYLNGRYTYRVEQEDGSYVRVGEEYFGPYDEVSVAHLSPDGNGYMYIYYMGDEKYLNVNGVTYGPYQELRGLYDFIYEYDSYFRYQSVSSPGSEEIIENPPQNYKKTYHDMEIRTAGLLGSTPGWYGQFSPDGKDWIFYVQENDQWYPLINGERQGNGYEKIIYHSFVPTSNKSNALTVFAQDITQEILWSDGTTTKRNGILDMYDTGNLKIMIYEYKGKKIVEVNGERFGVYDEIQEWFVEGDQLYIIARDRTNETKTLHTMKEAHGPHGNIEYVQFGDATFTYSLGSSIVIGNESQINLGVPILYFDFSPDKIILDALLNLEGGAFAFKRYSCEKK